DNLNIDLMFAIPTQTMATWRDTLREAIALGSEHLSSYEVIYEEDTPLYAQLKAAEFDVNEELACAMYDEFVATTGEHGLVQYEIANFARGQRMTNDECLMTKEGGSANDQPCVIPRFACAHNVNYW